MKRKHYIDNLRSASILLLIPYHAAMAWNCWGESNYIILGSDKAFSSFIIAISPWYMPLLFVLAGMSAKYSLQKRTRKYFIKERFQKLFLPFIAGTVIIMPILSFFADKSNCGYRGSFLDHFCIFYSRWSDLTGYDGGFGIGHLWFLLYLFVISLVSLGIDLLLQKILDRLHPENICTPMIIAFIMSAMIATPVELGSKSILTYLFLYLTGYYILSEETATERLERFRYLYLTIWILSTILNIYLFLYSQDDPQFLCSGLLRKIHLNITHSTWNAAARYLSGCFGILALLSFGKRLLHKANRFTTQLSADSFFIYLIHFPWVVIFEYYFSILIFDHRILFAASVFCAYILTFLSCKILYPRAKTLSRFICAIALANHRQ